MRISMSRLKAAVRWSAACCALALAAACQSPPPAPAPHGMLSEQQKQVLVEEGFREIDEGWELQMPGRLLFNSNSDVLNAPLRDKVERMGKALHGVGIDGLRVEGHTDNQGSKAYNEELSLRRARAVAQVLIDIGMEPGRIDVKGFGFNRPVVQNDSHADRKENRRVAIVVPVH